MIGDIAEFYRLALQHSHSSRHLVQVLDVTSWIDGVIASSDVAEEWMIDVSLAKTTYDLMGGLRAASRTATNYMGASLFVAHLGRLWSSGALARDEACHLLWDIRDDVRPEHELLVIVPEVTLEDADAVFEQGMRDPTNYARVDQSLDEFFALYREFSTLIPMANAQL